MKCFPILLLLFLFVKNGFSQINSLYSSYGLGVVDVRDYNMFTGMGGVGIALRSDRTISDLNPASFAGLDKDRLMMEIAFTGVTMNYVSSSQNVQGSDLALKRAAFGMNLFKNVGTVIGLKRYSTVSYKSVVQKDVEGGNTSLTDYISGTGGINMFYLGNGFQLGKNLSLGVTGGFMFGSVNQKDAIVAPGGSTTYFENNDFLNKAYWNTGFQYRFQSGKTNITLGAMVQPEIYLNRIRDFYIKGASENILLSDEELATDPFHFPLQWGGGFSIVRNRSTLSFDVIGQQWAGTGYRGSGFTSQDLRNYALGYKFTRQKSTWYGTADGLSLMVGLQYDNGYLKIQGHSVPTQLVSLGFSQPSFKSGTMFSGALRVGHRGLIADPLVKEKFVDFTFNVGLFTLMNKSKYIYD